MNFIRVLHADKDGTLMLSEDRNKSVIENLCADLGFLKNMDADERHAYWLENLWPVCEGQPEVKILQIVRDSLPELKLSALFNENPIATIAPAEFERLCKEGYDARHNEVTAREGIFELLNELKQGGTLLTLVTSSDTRSTEMDFGLVFDVAKGGYRFFDAVVTSDDITDPKHKKPAPTPYLYACAEIEVLDVDYGHIALEDSAVGTASAIRAFGEGDNLVIRFTDEPLPDNAPACLRHARDVVEAREHITTFQGNLYNRYGLQGKDLQIN